MNQYSRGDDLILVCNSLYDSPTLIMGSTCVSAFYISKNTNSNTICISLASLHVTTPKKM